QAGSESPTVWARLASLAQLAADPPAPSGPAPAPAGLLEPAWRKWYERRDSWPRPLYRQTPMTLHRTAKQALAICVPAKHGSSRWVKLLRRIDGHPDYRDFDVRSSGKLLRRLSDQPVAVQREVWASSAHFKVLVARNPLIRALSAYLEKRAELSLPPTFAAWVASELRRDKRGSADEHWRPPTESCESPARVHYDFIAHVETRSQWLPEFALLLGVRAMVDRGWGTSGDEPFAAAVGESEAKHADELANLQEHYTRDAFRAATCFYSRGHPPARL
ncbi:unnamed protein product, partial [Prorocentrum cordatum]